MGSGGGRIDVRQVITDRIIAMLEKGGNVFRARWTRAASRGMPRNGKTGAPYHGANVLLLWDAAIEQGYASNVWLTYKQAASLGAQVRRGERAVMCAHFERRARKGGAVDRDTAVRDGEEEEGREGGADAASTHGYLVGLPFWVFNVAQIDGLPAEVRDLCAASAPSPRGPVEGAFRLLAGCGATIRHGFDRAAYLPELDEIRLPWPDRFTSAEARCATSLHELVHWTGHASRLNRQFGARFGDAAYAFEELVAELGSAFLMGHCGLVEATVEGHAAYLDSWLQVLRGDRTAIFTAARHAGAAFDFILAREMPVLETSAAESPRR
ncbi:ArdC family protein [Variovorax fucosicus]|uniref:ArdC family protein n=1 Tax=Variovorax fucosicus TaxID=3053517 RepID=UPI0025758FC7|nr:zincin-like metallopeptidase domain-containing protein [Variovorax sp. J22G47]MDM0058935.1 zincin-like metallopeptidase domain-containing protein [Variovorax sp. J22G47]